MGGRIIDNRQIDNLQQLFFIKKMLTDKFLTYK